MPPLAASCHAAEPRLAKEEPGITGNYKGKMMRIGKLTGSSYVMEPLHSTIVYIVYVSPVNTYLH